MNAKKLRRRAVELRNKIDAGKASRQEIREYVKIFYEAWL